MEEILQLIRNWEPNGRRVLQSVHLEALYLLETYSGAEGSFLIKECLPPGVDYIEAKTETKETDGSGFYDVLYSELCPSGVHKLPQLLHKDLKYIQEHEDPPFVEGKTSEKCDRIDCLQYATKSAFLKVESSSAEPFEVRCGAFNFLCITFSEVNGKLKGVIGLLFPAGVRENGFGMEDMVNVSGELLASLHRRAEPRLSVFQDNGEYSVEQYKTLHKLIEDVSNISMERSVTRTKKFQGILGRLLRLTGTEYGFIGEIKYTEKDLPYGETFCCTSIAWNAATRKWFKDGYEAGLRVYKVESLYGLVMKGKDVISNAAVSDKRGCGIPPGHPPLSNYLGLAIVDGNGEPLGIISLANRPFGFSEKIVEFLKPLASAISLLITNMRLNQVNKEYRADLIKSKKDTEEADKAKMGMLSSMSHELKTPIGAIQGLVDLLSRSENDDERSEYLRMLESSTNRLHLHTTRMLDRARSFQQILTINFENFDIRKELDNTINAIIKQTGSPLPSLSVRTDESVPSLVCGDVIWFSHLISNLVQNAIKFTPVTGNVYVTLETVSEKVADVEKTEDNVILLLQIRDDGKGLDNLEKIFEPYYTSDRTRGLGFGLSFVREIIKGFGGSLKCESDGLGKGSNFKAFLPFRKVTNEAFVNHLLGADLNNPNPNPAVITGNPRIALLDHNVKRSAALAERIQKFGLTNLESFTDIDALKKEQRKSTGFPFVLLVVFHGTAPPTIIRELADKDTLFNIPCIVLAPKEAKLTQKELLAIETSPRLDEMRLRGKLNMQLMSLYQKPMHDNSFLQLLQDYLIEPSETFVKSNVNEEKQKSLEERKVVNQTSSSSDSSDISEVMNILLVDDESINRKIIRSLLKREENIAITEAVNGLDAVNKFVQGKGSFGLVLMDLRMPIMGGFEAMKSIREKESNLFQTDKSAFIAVQTADEACANFNEIMRYGDRFLTKPLNSKVLKLAIQDARKRLVT